MTTPRLLPRVLQKAALAYQKPGKKEEADRGPSSGICALEDGRDNETDAGDLLHPLGTSLHRARLWKQRDHLFVFLEQEGVEGTNNLAERQLRPAVIRRKLSCGNKSQRGARTFEVLTSVVATCRQRGQDFLELLSQAAPP